MSYVMDALQWGGVAGILGGYWFFITKPRIGCIISGLGCLLMGVWALLLTPVAWGVLTLEAVLLGLNIRNWWKAP